MTALRIDKILPNGDCGLIIQFVETSQSLAAIHALAGEFLAAPLPLMTNVIPATDSLVLVFNQPIDHSRAMVAVIKQRIQELEVIECTPQTHEIPVCYAATVAPDVESVCAALGLSLEQLVAHHTQPSYRVDMLGFLPGFAYLSGNCSALELPRKVTPSIQVPAGSVAVAGLQTGIYSLASPGGWHVIGRTPTQMLDYQNEQQPMRFKPLDWVNFKAISLLEYNTQSADYASSKAP